MRAYDRPPTELRLADDSKLRELRPATSTAHPTIRLGSCTQILFAKSDDTKTISLIERAVTLVDNDNTPLLTEYHYYLLSHSPKHRKESGRILKTLLTDGVTTGDWSFEMNLERLQREEGPRLDLLEVVVRTLEDGDMSRLNTFGE